MKKHNFEASDIEIFFRYFELNILSQAMRYNLNEDNQRKISTKYLENLYININKLLNPPVYFEIGAH
ncbi:MAG: hypothetical protein ACOC4J_05400 [Bacteroidota bacterium]